MHTTDRILFSPPLNRDVTHHAGAATTQPPPRSPFGGGQAVTLGGLDPLERRLVMALDTILAEPSQCFHLPQEVWAFDSDSGVFRRVEWASPWELRGFRRTALAVAQHEHRLNGRLWEVN